MRVAGAVGEEEGGVHQFLGEFEVFCKEGSFVSGADPLGSVVCCDLSVEDEAGEVFVRCAFDVVFEGF